MRRVHAFPHVRTAGSLFVVGNRPTAGQRIDGRRSRASMKPPRYGLASVCACFAHSRAFVVSMRCRWICARHLTCIYDGSSVRRVIDRYRPWQGYSHLDGEHRIQG